MRGKAGQAAAEQRSRRLVPCTLSPLIIKVDLGARELCNRALVGLPCAKAAAAIAATATTSAAEATTVAATAAAEATAVTTTSAAEATAVAATAAAAAAEATTSTPRVGAAVLVAGLRKVEGDGAASNFYALVRLKGGLGLVCGGKVNVAKAGGGSDGEE